MDAIVVGDGNGNRSGGGNGNRSGGGNGNQCCSGKNGYNRISGNFTKPTDSFISFFLPIYSFLPPWDKRNGVDETNEN
ncbi:unnamed protein product [Wuchereria bancrofti]|uniref:Uncharacterized protein n=1 Tax=Wuchereria bancrofti TaxID=6293 RepID=A0A3P7FL55_WUCBA|nr:unnamed protein product [Wuchereria bancrofti]